MLVLIGLELVRLRRPRAELALKQSSELLSTILERSPIAITAVDMQQRVLLWNPAAERLFGWRADEVVGRVYPIVPDDLREDFWLLVERVEDEGAIANVQRPRQRKDGSIVTVSLAAAALRHPSGRPTGYVVLAVDLSERQQLEAQLRQAQKMEAVGRLAGGVAHDFNNLLTVISSYADVLDADFVATDPRREHVAEIRAAAARAATLTRQLLSFSRKQVVAARPLDVDEVIRGMEPMLRRLITSDVALEFLLNASPGAVRIDAGQLEQVIMNLVINAADAITDPGGRITIATHERIVREAEEPPATDTPRNVHVAIEVRDTGHGMDEATRSRIFEPFFTTKPPGQGTGLGLATVYGIVAQYGGLVDVHSDVGRGTSVTVCLPVVKDAVAQPAPERAQLMPRGTETILLVDDETAVRESLKRLLTRLGYSVLTANNGGEALRVATAYEGPIHLILTDLTMPELGGRQFVERMPAERAGTRVLFMSGYSDAEAQRRQPLAPGHAFIQKPFSMDELARRIREILSG